MSAASSCTTLLPAEAGLATTGLPNGSSDAQGRGVLVPGSSGACGVFRQKLRLIRAQPLQSRAVSQLFGS